MTSLQPTPDRLAALESRLLRVETELLASRRRRAELVASTPLWPAWTVEPDSGYPAYGTSIELPIVTASCKIVSDELVETHRWSTEFQELAISRIGWLPPGVRVWVTHYRGRYLIVEGPTVLHGRATTSISAASWVSGCEQLETGSGTVHLYDLDGSGRDVPQYYEDGTTAVTMTWRNTSALVAGNKLLTALRDVRNRWIVVIEPCDLACTPAAPTTTTTTTTGGS
jgi:hypothetical protein